MSLYADFQVAVRGLFRDRAYTAIALLTLAFGIAARGRPQSSRACRSKAKTGWISCRRKARSARCPNCRP